MQIEIRQRRESQAKQDRSESQEQLTQSQARLFNAQMQWLAEFMGLAAVIDDALILEQGRQKLNSLELKEPYAYMVPDQTQTPRQIILRRLNLAPIPYSVLIEDLTAVGLTLRDFVDRESSPSSEGYEAFRTVLNDLQQSNFQAISKAAVATIQSLIEELRTRRQVGGNSERLAQIEEEVRALRSDIAFMREMLYGPQEPNGNGHSNGGKLLTAIAGFVVPFALLFASALAGPFDQSSLINLSEGLGRTTDWRAGLEFLPFLFGAVTPGNGRPAAVDQEPDDDIVIETQENIGTLKIGFRVFYDTRLFTLNSPNHVKAVKQVLSMLDKTPDYANLLNDSTNRNKLTGWTRQSKLIEGEQKSYRVAAFKLRINAYRLFLAVVSFRGANGNPQVRAVILGNIEIGSAAHKRRFYSRFLLWKKYFENEDLDGLIERFDKTKRAEINNRLIFGEVNPSTLRQERAIRRESLLQVESVLSQLMRLPLERLTSFTAGIYERTPSEWVGQLRAVLHTAEGNGHEGRTQEDYFIEEQGLQENDRRRVEAVFLNWQNVRIRIIAALGRLVENDELPDAKLMAGLWHLTETLFSSQELANALLTGLDRWAFNHPADGEYLDEILAEIVNELKSSAMEESFVEAWAAYRQDSAAANHQQWQMEIEYWETQRADKRQQEQEAREAAEQARAEAQRRAAAAAVQQSQAKAAGPSLRDLQEQAWRLSQRDFLNEASSILTAVLESWMTAIVLARDTVAQRAVSDIEKKAGAALGPKEGRYLTVKEMAAELERIRELTYYNNESSELRQNIKNVREGLAQLHERTVRPYGDFMSGYVVEANRQRITGPAHNSVVNTVMLFLLSIESAHKQIFAVADLRGINGAINDLETVAKAAGHPLDRATLEHGLTHVEIVLDWLIAEYSMQRRGRWTELSVTLGRRYQDLKAELAALQVAVADPTVADQDLRASALRFLMQLSGLVNYEHNLPWAVNATGYQQPNYHDAHEQIAEISDEIFVVLGHDGNNITYFDIWYSNFDLTKKLLPPSPQNPFIGWEFELPPEVLLKKKQEAFAKMLVNILQRYRRHWSSQRLRETSVLDRTKGMVRIFYSRQGGPKKIKSFADVYRELDPQEWKDLAPRQVVKDLKELTQEFSAYVAGYNALVSRADTFKDGELEAVQYLLINQVELEVLFKNVLSWAGDLELVEDAIETLFPQGVDAQFKEGAARFIKERTVLNPDGLVQDVETIIEKLNGLAAEHRQRALGRNTTAVHLDHLVRQWQWLKGAVEGNDFTRRQVQEIIPVLMLSLSELQSSLSVYFWPGPQREDLYNDTVVLHSVVQIIHGLILRLIGVAPQPSTASENVDRVSTEGRRTLDAMAQYTQQGRLKDFIGEVDRILTVQQRLAKANMRNIPKNQRMEAASRNLVNRQAVPGFVKIYETLEGLMRRLAGAGFKPEFFSDFSRFLVSIHIYELLLRAVIKNFKEMPSHRAEEVYGLSAVVGGNQQFYSDMETLLLELDRIYGVFLLAVNMSIYDGMLHEEMHRILDKERPHTMDSFGGILGDIQKISRDASVEEEIAAILEGIGRVQAVLEQTLSHRPASLTDILEETDRIKSELFKEHSRLELNGIYFRLMIMLPTVFVSGRNYYDRVVTGGAPERQIAAVWDRELKFLYTATLLLGKTLKQNAGEVADSRLDVAEPAGGSFDGPPAAPKRLSSLLKRLLRMV